MKLISKTISYYLLISLPLLIIAGFLSYYLIRSEVRDGTDETLAKEKINAEQLIRLNTGKKIIYLSTDSLTSIVPVSFHENDISFSNEFFFDKTEKEEVNFRLLKSHYNYNNQTYLISIRKTTLEEDELLEGLFSSFAIIIVFLVLAFFAVNWLLSKTIWKPFYKTLNVLNDYDLKNYSTTKFKRSGTKEFDQLNMALNQMTEKIYSDFLQQKEFTENAAHEMQTPLAVIKANLNLLMQSPNLQAEEMSHLQAIDNTVKKLSSLNKALLLLAKIENHQFKENALVDINTIIKKTLHHFEDLLIAKHLAVENNITVKFNIQINPALADILITNLIQNAIRHNTIGGKIIIDLKDNALIIANTGEALNINPKDLFVRFKKNDASKESTGLGLSIVKSIANLYHLTISYNYHHSLHIFTLNF